MTDLTVERLTALLRGADYMNWPSARQLAEVLVARGVTIATGREPDLSPAAYSKEEEL